MTSYPIRNLSVLSYSQGFTLWHYGARTIAPIREAPQIFLELLNYEKILLGDIMLVSAPDGALQLVIVVGPLYWNCQILSASQG